MFLDLLRQDYADHFDWRKGRMDSIFRIQPDNVNGLALVAPQQLWTKFNYFGAVSRFFSDAMIGDMPSSDPAASLLLENLTEHWSVTGEGCIVGTPGMYRAVRPDYVYPVFNIYDRDSIDGFVFAFPERNRKYETREENRVTYAERARVIQYDATTGQAWQSIRQYRQGWVADTPLGDPVDIGRVIWIDTKDGVFNQMDGIVREINVRLNILQQFLNTVSKSILQIDTDAISGGTVGRGSDQNAINRASSTGLGLTVDPPFVGEEGARYVERSGAGLTESLDYMRTLLGQLSVISGVPDYIFGVQLGRPTDETERILFSGQAKVSRFRRNIETAFGMIGSPIKFATEPFTTRSQKLDGVVKQYESGLITLNEGRLTLGYPPLPDGDKLFDGAIGNAAVRAMLTNGGA